MRRISVIIPTYNRPNELRVCMRSLVRQSTLPDEILVVDDGDLKKVPHSEEADRRGITCRHLHKDTPGLTESRNRGIEESTGDIIFFFDDDVKLFPDYIENVLDIYRRDPDHRIGGVGGNVINTKPMSLPRLLRYALDLPCGISGVKEGRVLRSGFCTDFGTTPFPIRSPRPVEFLPGAAFSFRREVFARHRFQPGFRDVALGEDKDFSIEVGHDYRLVFHPHARLYHYESELMRPAKRNWGRKHINGHYLIFRRYVKTQPLDWLFFWYAVLIYLAERSLIAGIQLDRSQFQHVLGAFDALLAIVRGTTDF